MITRIRAGVRFFSAALAVPLLCAAAMQTKADDQDRKFEIYGIAETDYIQDSERVDPNWIDAFRPSKIGVADPNDPVYTNVNPYGSNGDSSVSVKQSRFGVKGTQPTGDGQALIDFKFEFDLFDVSAGARQATFPLRQVNSEW